jgi:hypothetical protein
MIVRGPLVRLPSSLLRTRHTFGRTSGESPSRCMMQVLLCKRVSLRAKHRLAESLAGCQACKPG